MFYLAVRRARRILMCFCGALVFSANAQSETRHALLIGISDYAPPAHNTIHIPPGKHTLDSRFAPGESWPDLHGPPNDLVDMEVLLEQKFGFGDVRVLKEKQATRRGILTAIRQLISDTHPGDFDVIYYSGHGSRRLDTLSSKHHFDETIVPRDAWKGVEDIRDKELAMYFDRIVYDKHSHLTAIFDSCSSGTMARGITDSVVRALPYDDRDVATEKRKDAKTVVESDLRRIPQDGDAIIVAAADAAGYAAEAQYADDLEWHGAFTRALVRLLRSNTQTLSADDLVAEISAVLHADPLPFQQPSVEGRTEESLFGDPVSGHGLLVHVSHTSDAGIILDMGSAAGFDVGTQFTSVEPTSDGQRTAITIQSVDEPLVSTAHVISGPTDVSIGQAFELTKMSYPEASRLTIFTPPLTGDDSAASAGAALAFPYLEWVPDPTDRRIDFLVVDGRRGWTAYDRRGRGITPSAKPRGIAFLLLGPPESLRTALEASAPFQGGAFAFTEKLAQANYLLAGRSDPRAGIEYALFDRVEIMAHDPAAWLHSRENNDPDDAALNGGAPPEVICRNDASLPVRTAWLPDTDRNSLIHALLERITRIGKLRTWIGTPALAPGIPGWPYRPEITVHNSQIPLKGVLHRGEQYDVRLITAAERRAGDTPIPRYVYLLGFDCAGNPFLLYPKSNLNGDATVPQPGTDGIYPLSVSLGVQEEVDTPLGADTLFLLVTAQKLTDPGILLEDGVLDQTARGVENPFDELIADMSDAGVRGPHDIPDDWTVQPLVVPSKP